MKIEEAIERLTDEKETIIKARAVYKLPDYGYPDEQYDVAIAALEKQIAKKPIELPEEETFYDGGYYGHKCGMCEFPVYDDQIYCDKCGQKLDWGNE